MDIYSMQRVINIKNVEKLVNIVYRLLVCAVGQHEVVKTIMVVNIIHLS